MGQLVEARAEGVSTWHLGHFLAQFQIRRLARAVTAGFAAVHKSPRTTRHSRVTIYFVLQLHGVLCRALVQHEPCAREARMRPANNYNLLFDAWFFKHPNLLHSLYVPIPSEKIVRGNHAISPSIQLWKPVEELWVNYLLSSVCKYNVLGSEVDGLLCLRHPELRGP